MYKEIHPDNFFLTDDKHILSISWLKRVIAS